jgi:hypothetical protein
VYLSFAAPIGLYGAAWPDARHEFGQTAGALGAVVTAYSIGRTSTSASALVVLRRVPIGIATAACCLVLAAADVVVAVGRSFPALVAAVGVVGLMSGVLDSLGSRFQTVVRDVSRSGLVLGAYGVGATLAPALTAVTSWTTGNLVAAGAAVVAAIVAVGRSVPWPEGLADEPTPSDAPGSDRPAPPAPIRRLPLLVSLGLAVACVGVEAMTGNWMATVLEDHRGASARHVGLAMSGFWGGVTVGRLALARVHVGPRRLLVGASTATLVSVALLGVVPIGVALVGLVVVGLSVAPLFPTVVSTTADRVGVEAAGRVSGWQLLSGNGSIIVMTALLGIAVSLWGEGVPYYVVLGLAGGAAVLSRVAARLPAAAGDDSDQTPAGERAS